MNNFNKSLNEPSSVVAWLCGIEVEKRDGETCIVLIFEPENYLSRKKKQDRTAVIQYCIDNLIFNK